MNLTINHLYKAYGTKNALSDINLHFDKGVYGLLGPNGAGKTTLMIIIVDNMPYDKGEVLLDNSNIHSLGEAYRKILGYMPQQQGIYDDFTARRFLTYIGALKGMDKNSCASRIKEVLEAVNLTEEADKKLGGFSGGMKQRILIAQAILDKPEILILDEPTAGLDPKERIRIRNLISKISLDKIVIIATHVVQDIEFIANKVILLEHGRITAVDHPVNLIKAIEDKVFELDVAEEQLEAVSENYRIGNIQKDESGLHVKVISDRMPSEYAYHKVRASIEDVYLYYFTSKE